MAVLLRDLCEQVKDYGMELIAGRNGLGRPVRWVHMVENQEIANFLEGQEIAFATGIGVQTQEDLCGLVKSVYSNDASGFVVNIGPYIHQISPETVRFCNDHDLPLFRVPWSVHMAQIMHVFSLAITMSEKHNMELAAALRNAIECPDREEMYLDYLEQSGFNRGWNYCVAALEAHDKTTRSCLESVVDLCIAQNGWKAAMLELNGRLVIVFAQYGSVAVRDMVMAILNAARARGVDTGRVFVGVGKVTKSARCIRKSCGQAMRLERLQFLRGNGAVPALYDESGVDKILLGVEDVSILDDYYADSIAPLVNYDKAHDSDLVDTLRTYLKFNGSVKETAESMFVHRNTVNYKLGKIETVLGVDLGTYSVREFLSIGLQVDEILQCMRLGNEGYQGNRSAAP